MDMDKEKGLDVDVETEAVAEVTAEDVAVETDPVKDGQTPGNGKLASRLGLGISVLGLLVFNMLGVVPLVGIVFSVAGLIRSTDEDKGSKIIALIGMAIGLAGMVWGFIQMLNMLA